MSQEVFDVLIIGAGLSGLSASYEIVCRQPNLKYAVLEAKDRIGGRTLAVNLNTLDGKDSWDLGGQWIGKCQPHIYRLVDSLGLEVFHQFNEGQKLVQLGDDCSLIKYTSDIPLISFLAVFELQCFIWKVSSFMKDMKSKDFMSSGKASKLDNMTLEHYKQVYFWTKGAKNTLDACCRCIFGTDPAHMSLLYFLHYVHMSGNFEALLSCKPNFGAQELKIKGGAWQICDQLMKRLPQSSVHLSSPVVSIDQRSEGFVKVSTASGEVFSTRYVIMAIPPNQLVRICFNPSLPLPTFHVLQHLPVGYLTKILITYSEAFWRKNGYSGEVLTSGCNGEHPLCVVFDATSSNNNAALVAFVGGSQQLLFSSLQAESRKTLVLKTLESFFGSEALKPLDYIEKSWNDEPYNGGCPTNVASPGVTTNLHLALSSPFYRVHFAGTESATSWCGFLNGAVQSGQRAAHEVLHNLSPEVLTKEDLNDTCYAFTKFEDIRFVKKHPKPYFKLILISLSLVAISFYAFKRRFKYL